MRMIVRFGKLGRLKFISHLDLQRFMQRALRRSGLPVAYSQGFNPHAVMSFASALGMGTESVCELLDVKLLAGVSREDALSGMRSALPPEMPVYDVRFVDDAHPAFMARLACARYTIEPLADFDKLAEAAKAYMAETSVIALRKTKTGEKPADIRKMTRELRAEGGAFDALLSLTETETLKCDLLVRTLAERAGVDAPDFRCRREAMYAVNDGELIELFEC